MYVGHILMNDFFAFSQRSMQDGEEFDKDIIHLISQCRHYVNTDSFKGIYFIAQKTLVADVLQN